MEIKYVAMDGTEFANKEECEAYENTSLIVLDLQFEKLAMQRTHSFAENTCFGDFSYDDEMIAVKIENAEQLGTVNKWIKAHHNPDQIGIDKIGTIQLIDVYGNDVWLCGTPAEFKEKCIKDIDRFFNKLIEKGEK